MSVHKGVNALINTHLLAIFYFILHYASWCGIYCVPVA